MRILAPNKAFLGIAGEDSSLPLLGGEEGTGQLLAGTMTLSHPKGVRGEGSGAGKALSVGTCAEMRTQDPSPCLHFCFHLSLSD